MKRRRRTHKPPAGYRRYTAPAMTGALRPAPPRPREFRQVEARLLDRPRVVSGVILMVLAVTGMWIGFGDAFYVTSLKVTGNSRIAAEEIAAGSRIAGMHVLWVNSGEVEATLRAGVPSLRSSRVACSLPARCSIAVTEREPLLAWRWGQAVMWIDQAGVSFAARGDVPGLLTIESVDTPPPPPGKQLEPKVITAIVSVGLALPDVRAYRYSALHGLEFDDPDGYPVYVGTGSNMGDRVVVWRALRQDLTARGIQPAYVDVRYPLAPFYGQ